jgi:hypothetical protein
VLATQLSDDRPGGDTFTARLHYFTGADCWNQTLANKR